MLGTAPTDAHGRSVSPDMAGDPCMEGCHYRGVDPLTVDGGIRKTWCKITITIRFALSWLVSRAAPPLAAVRFEIHFFYFLFQLQFEGALKTYIVIPHIHTVHMIRNMIRNDFLHGATFEIRQLFNGADVYTSS